MLILAIDLGKAKSLACWYQAGERPSPPEDAEPPQSGIVFRTGGVLSKSKRLDRSAVIVRVIRRPYRGWIRCRIRGTRRASRADRTRTRGNTPDAVGHAAASTPTAEFPATGVQGR